MLKNIYHYAMQIFNKDQLSTWKGCDSTSFRILLKNEDDNIMINVADRYIDDGYRITSNDGKIFMSVLNDKQACQVLDQIKKEYSLDYMVKIDKQYIIKVANKNL